MSHLVAPDGVLLVDKAEGMTSHDVVALVRRKLQVRKVVHCGTLDPIATGLLLITVGRGKKHGGVPLYKLARQGKVVEREPRLVHVYRYTIDRIALPEIDFSLLCSKGFYVRTYAHDIGETLGCGAHLKSLRRTRSGRFDVANAISVAQIKDAPREEILSRLLSLPDVSRMRGA